MPATSTGRYRRAILMLLGLGTAALQATAVAANACSPCYHVRTIDNPADPAFNQLLGINNRKEIVGFDGDGVNVANQGYRLHLPNRFINENVPNSVQSQVIGIDNEQPAASVGFYADAAGNNIGFYQRGSQVLPVADPNVTPFQGFDINQLLGLNSSGQAVGFYNDSVFNSHGYVYDIASGSFTELSLPFSGVASFQSTAINDGGYIVGFWNRNNGILHGFVGLAPNDFIDVQPPAGFNNLSLLGLNNNGIGVGNMFDHKGVSRGITYDGSTGAIAIVDVPHASSVSVAGFNGTTINGINDADAVVGFYSDGTNLHGFLGTPAPAK